MTILLFFAFLAGVVTILAPCIWPLLPIVLSASSGQGKKRPLGITLGVMTSFTIFTLSISYLEKILHINANVFRLVAVIIIVALGIAMMIPSLGTHFENLVNQGLSPFQNKLQQSGSGFGAGYATGFSVGLVWAPCAGPILATIATLAATQAVNAKVILLTLAYVTGLGIPLFFFSLFGAWSFGRMRRLNKYTGRIQQVFGAIMIVAALLIYTNYDKVIQVRILNLFPAYGKIFESIENNERVSQELNVLRGDEGSPQAARPASSTGELPDLGPAAEFTGIAQWLNTDTPLTMQQLRGKVVLIDFWTYSCINCVRTLPHVTGWYEQYKDQNFIVVGIHTPEFAFEKDVKNVQNALGQFKIHYPVALDNSYGTWKAYNNHYWPAKYLVDARGHLRLTHFGEGHYEEMGMAIRQLITESGQTVNSNVNALPDQTPKTKRTPETYLGSARLERFASTEDITGGVQTFTYPSNIPIDQFAYAGPWTVTKQAAQAKQGASLELHFQADQVYLVMGPQAPGSRVQVFLDGKPLDSLLAGVDVKDGGLTLDTERLYHLIDLKGRPGEHLLRLEFLNDDISVYAFTFG